MAEVSTGRADTSTWTRRGFVRAGLVTSGAAALGARAHWHLLRAAAAAESASGLDELSRSVRGRFLRAGSPGYGLESGL